MDYGLINDKMDYGLINNYFYLLYFLLYMKRSLTDFIYKYNKKVIGHGGCGHYKHNSWMAIQYCINKGIKNIEIDIQRCSDGYILYHDEQLENGLFIQNFTKEECRNIENILSLEVLYNMINENDIFIYMDLKFHPKWTEEFYNIVYPKFKNYSIASFYDKHLEMPWPHKTLLSCSIPSDNFKESIDKLGVKCISLYHNNLSTELVNYLKSMDLEIYVWTVNNNYLALKVINDGVDGIITDLV